MLYLSVCIFSVIGDVKKRLNFPPEFCAPPGSKPASATLTPFCARHTAIHPPRGFLISKGTRQARHGNMMLFNYRGISYVIGRTLLDVIIQHYLNRLLRISHLLLDRFHLYYLVRNSLLILPLGI